MKSKPYYIIIKTAIVSYSTSDGITFEYEVNKPVLNKMKYINKFTTLQSAKDYISLCTPSYYEKLMEILKIENVLSKDNVLLHTLTTPVRLYRPVNNKWEQFKYNRKE